MTGRPWQQRNHWQVCAEALRPPSAYVASSLTRNLPVPLSKLQPVHFGAFGTPRGATATAAAR